MQECPRRIKGDAAGRIEAPEDGAWTEAVRETYADRIIDRLARYIPNLKDSIIARTVLSPADLEAVNINLVGGDPYGGACSLDQIFLWRPLRSLKNHDTSAHPPIRDPAWAAVPATWLRRAWLDMGGQDIRGQSKNSSNFLL